LLVHSASGARKNKKIYLPRSSKAPLKKADKNDPAITFVQIILSPQGCFMTITQRLVMIFSLLAMSLIALVIISLSVISGFQSRFEYVQVNAIPSIRDLNKSISEALLFTAITAPAMRQSSPLQKSALIICCSRLNR